MAEGEVDKRTIRFDIIEPDFTHKGQQYVHHSGLNADNIAFRRLIPKQSIILIAVLVVLGGGAAPKLACHTTYRSGHTDFLLYSANTV